MKPNHSPNDDVKLGYISPERKQRAIKALTKRRTKEALELAYWEVKQAYLLGNTHRRLCTACRIQHSKSCNHLPPTRLGTAYEALKIAFHDLFRF